MRFPGLSLIILKINQVHLLCSSSIVIFYMNVDILTLNFYICSYFYPGNDPYFQPTTSAIRKNWHGSPTLVYRLVVSVLSHPNQSKVSNQFVERRASNFVELHVIGLTRFSSTILCWNAGRRIKNRSQSSHSKEVNFLTINIRKIQS